MAAPVSENELTRLLALHEYRILDTEPEDAYDDIVRLAAFICATPISAVSLVDVHRQWFKSVLGLSIREFPRDVSFCAHAILQPDVMVVPDAQADPRFQDNLLVTGEPHIRFYAGAPLITESGQALGSLCVIDTVPRTLTPEQEDALRSLARHVVAQMELSRRTAALERVLAERELADELLGLREDDLRQLGAAVESVTDGVVIVDARQPDLPMTYVNPAFLDMTGYEMHEVIGRNCRFLQGTQTDPDTRQRLHRAITQRLPCRVTLLNYRKDGSTFWNYLTISLVRGDKGDLTHFIGIQHDITGLKETEARLVEAQQIGGIGDWELDLATWSFTWSAEVFRLMEFDPAEGTPPYAAVQARYHPDDRVVRDRVFTQSLETGEPYRCDLRLVLPSGTPRWCHLVGRPVLGEDGKVTRIVGTAQDTTEMLAREQQVRDANAVLEVQAAQLQAANQELSVLATTDPLTGLLNYRAFQMRLQEETAHTLAGERPRALAVVNLDGFRFFNEVYGHGVGDFVLREVADRLREACGEGNFVARIGGDEFTVLLASAGQAVSAAEVEARLRDCLDGLTFQPAGEASAIPIKVSVGAALLTEGQSDHQEALRRAEERLRRAKAGENAETEAVRVRVSMGSEVDGFSMLDALVTAVDNKDRYTRRHSEDVMDYCLMIARALGFSAAEQHTVAVAALLHDVGKIGVPDTVLRKPGRLTEDEFSAVKQHPQMGAIIVQAVPGLEGTLDAVRHHHERWDGGGYPFGLRGEATPLIARLMAVADAYSAMTTSRPYREGMDGEKALTILVDGAGTQWDPRCVEAFLAVQERADSTSLGSTQAAKPDDPA